MITFRASSESVTSQHRRHSRQHETTVTPNHNDVNLPAANRDGLKKSIFCPLPALDYTRVRAREGGPRPRRGLLRGGRPDAEAKHIHAPFGSRDASGRDFARGWVGLVPSF